MFDRRMFGPGVYSISMVTGEIGPGSRYQCSEFGEKLQRLEDEVGGKRTGVRVAHDRYANFETNYLLQRLESFDSLVLVTRNLRENIDSAFLRRIRFVVELP